LHGGCGLGAQALHTSTPTTLSVTVTVMGWCKNKQRFKTVSERVSHLIDSHLEHG